MINTLIHNIENFITNNPKEAAVGGIFITIGSEFMEYFNALHIPDVVVPTLQAVLLTVSILLGIKGFTKKNKQNNEGDTNG